MSAFYDTIDYYGNMMTTTQQILMILKLLENCSRLSYREGINLPTNADLVAAILIETEIHTYYFFANNMLATR